MSAAEPAEQRRNPWLGIELRHLVALSAIEREGTFSEAALSLGYVQSAVSGQIATLERLIGTRLVERSHGPGRQHLTAAGSLLLAHAREILEEIGVARERLAAHAESERTGLRIGITPGVPDRIVGPVLHTVLSATVGLSVSRVETIDCGRVARALAEEDADIALTTLPLDDPQVATAELTRQPPVVMVQAASPLAQRRLAPTLEELSRLPLIAWREGIEPSRIERELADRSLTPEVVVRTDSSDTVGSLVRKGLGAAILPHAAVGKNPEPGIALLGLCGALPERVIGIAWSRGRVADRRVRCFIDLACRLRSRL
jgi:molybdate transport repressor ModE-like protein